MNIKYQKLVKTGQEPEYKVSPFLVISSIGAEIKKNSSSMPYGTAVLTDTGSASSLKSQGINYIIHATPMPEGDSREKFVEVAARTIQNSIILAEREGISKLATCFLAGKIYLKHPSSRPYLAEGIIEAALNQLQENSLQESDCPPTISKTRVEKGNLCQKTILGALGTEANNVDQQRKSLMKKFNELINGQQQKDNNKKPNQQEPNKNDKPNPGKDEKQPSDDSQEPTPDNGNGNNDNGGNKKDDNQEPTDKGQKNSNDTDKNP
ncbi:21544_t:CDS:2, partial [Racocetra persica]